MEAFTVSISVLSTTARSVCDILGDMNHLRGVVTLNVRYDCRGTRQSEGMDTTKDWVIVGKYVGEGAV